MFYQKLDKFLNGKARPEISWASFENSKVQGAFVASTNTILISEAIKGNGNLLNRVVLEEIGHWLEADSEKDSLGDEGSVFVESIQDENKVELEAEDSKLLLIEGDYFSAEFSEAEDSNDR